MFKCVLISYMSTYMSKGGSQVLQNFEGELLIGEWGGEGVRSIFQGGTDTLEDTMVPASSLLSIRSNLTYLHGFSCLCCCHSS